MRALLLGLLITIFSGSAFAQATPENGPPIAQDEAESKATEFLTGILKDPYSAVYTWSPVYAGWWKDGLLEGRKVHTGWVLKGTVNSKNSYGGFVGQTPVAFVFHDGVLIAAYMEHRGRRNSRTMQKIL